MDRRLGTVAREVPYAAAIAAQEVIVRRHVTIVADEVTAVDLGDQSLALELIKIPVDRSQTYLGQVLADQEVKLIATRVGLELAQFL